MTFSGRLGVEFAGACACAAGAIVTAASDNLSAQASLLKSRLNRAGGWTRFRADAWPFINRLLVAALHSALAHYTHVSVLFRNHMRLVPADEGSVSGLKTACYA